LDDVPLHLWAALDKPASYGPPPPMRDDGTPLFAHGRYDMRTAASPPPAAAFRRVQLCRREKNNFGFTGAITLLVLNIDTESIDRLNHVSDRWLDALWDARGHTALTINLELGASQ
jgi:hypothetical protein